MFDMKRRQFITLLGGAAAVWPLAARAQQPRRTKLIGVLLPYDASDPEGQSRINTFRKELQNLGWTEGGNVRIEVRWPSSNADRMQAYAVELVAQMPDAIVVNSNLGVAALQRAQATLPVVFVGVSDPVNSGFIKSLARPGGNITGFTNFEAEIGGKWLQILKEIAQGLRRVLLLLHPEIAANVAIAHAVEAAAPSVELAITLAGVRDGAEIKRAITAFTSNPNGGLIASPNPINIGERDLIIGLAAHHRLPAVYPYRLFAASGGLVSYGIDQVDMFRRAASYVDRILKGERPGDLPVQQPTKYETVITSKLRNNSILLSQQRCSRAPTS